MSRNLEQSPFIVILLVVSVVGRIVVAASGGGCNAIYPDPDLLWTLLRNVRVSQYRKRIIVGRWPRRWLYR